jgi:lysophospholipase L1-like esterase
MQKDIYISVFGTSTTYGAWDQEGGWVERLKKSIYGKRIEDSEYFCMMYNLGIDGNTSEDILERFESEIKRRIGREQGNKIIIIFNFGVNDSAFIHSKNELWVPQERFNENTEKIINLAKKYSPEVFLVGEHSFDERISDPVS